MSTNIFMLNEINDACSNKTKKEKYMWQQCNFVVANFGLHLFIYKMKSLENYIYHFDTFAEKICFINEK